VRNARKTSRMTPRTVSVVLRLVLLGVLVPGTVHPKCATTNVKLVSLVSDTVEFLVSIPASWEATVAEAPSRVSVADANTRCSLSITVAVSVLSLDSVIRLYEGLYHGADLLSSDCRETWTSRMVWADRAHLAEYRRRYMQETVYALYAQAGDRQVTARLSCRTPERASSDWSTALAIFASIFPSTKPPLPGF